MVMQVQRFTLPFFTACLRSTTRARPFLPPPHEAAF
jgi:hypothetical protein